LGTLMLAAPEELKAWARGRRGPGKSDNSRQFPTNSDRPEWLGPRLGVSERIASGEPWSQREEIRLISALAVIPIPAEDRDTRVLYGMALKRFEPVRGLEIWDRWLAQLGDKYPGRAKVEAKWDGFSNDYNGRQVTIETIYYHARSLGWIDPSNVISKANGMEALTTVLPAALTANPIKWGDFDKHGHPKATCHNTRIALRFLGIECRYDLFHGRQYVNGQAIERWAGEIADDTILAVRALIRECWRLDPPTQTTIDALTMECIEHAYDPILDYLDRLAWDGRPRLATWMPDYMGADDTPLNRMIGGLSLVAAVRRARVPGAKFDHVIVLEGLEGMGKSSAVAILAGVENFSDQEILTLDDRRQQEALQGVWLYEIAELAGMHRADIERVKAFVTRTTDRTRPAYGRRRVDKARRTIFFASCNNQRYLLSQTGNRRFWPVACQWVKPDELALARDQLWAEASMIERRGGSLALPSAFWPHASEMQESRRVRDPWEDKLHGIEYYKHAQKFENCWPAELRITTIDLLSAVLEIPTAQQTTSHYHRLGTVMRLMGWEGPKDIRTRLTEKEDATRVCKGFIMKCSG
jgi:Virulence-associated protein E